LERALALDALSELERDSTAHEFIKAVVERPGSTNYEIATMLSTSDAEISRVGRRLTDAGLAAKRRVGRRNHWEVTPKGIHALDLLESGGASRLRRPNLQLQ
jgi:DNA-binding transcriptional ArsR family regulator